MGSGLPASTGSLCNFHRQPGSVADGQTRRRAIDGQFDRAATNLFADALKGMKTMEEVQDEPVEVAEKEVQGTHTFETKDDQLKSALSTNSAEASSPSSSAESEPDEDEAALVEQTESDDSGSTPTFEEKIAKVTTKKALNQIMNEIVKSVEEQSERARLAQVASERMKEL